MNRKLLVLLTGLLVLGACGNATAEPSRIEMEMVTTEYETRFVREGDGPYELTMSRQVNYTAISVDGAEPVTDRSVDKRLPSADKGESLRVRLSGEGATRFLTSEEVFEGDGELVRHVTRGELVVVEGSWEAFEAGETIGVQYTPEAIDQITRASDDMVRAMLARILARPGHDTAVVVTSERLPNPTLTLSRTELHATSQQRSRTVVDVVYTPRS